MSEFLKMKAKHGAFKKGNKEVALTQEAYIEQSHDTVYYTAMAIDKDGVEYEVKWNTVKGYQKHEDESDRCDWNKPASITKY